MTNQKRLNDEAHACADDADKGRGRAVWWVWSILGGAVFALFVANLTMDRTKASVSDAASCPGTPTARDGAGATAVTAQPVGLGRPLPRLLDLGAGKCVPCKLMAPILEDLKTTYAGKFDVQFIDVWEDRDAVKTYGIRAIPTQIFYDAAGKELFRHEGFFGKDDILAKWRELGEDWGKTPATSVQSSE